MNKTAIEWVKNPDGSQGYTWNPITGCLNGCPYCYARKLANGRLRQRYLGGNCEPAPYEHNSQVILDPFYPRFWEDRLYELYPISRTSKGIFVCDMGELFGDWIPEGWTSRVMNQIELHPEHRFYLLTKQPQNLIKFSPFPDNCWVGVTITNPFMFYKACEFLGQIDAPKVFLSLEPLLQEIKIPDAAVFNDYGISWVIIGAQTKPTVYPSFDWLLEIVTACDKAKVPIFLKNNLVGMLVGLADPRKKILYSETGLRQELPE